MELKGKLIMRSDGQRFEMEAVSLSAITGLSAKDMLSLRSSTSLQVYRTPRCRLASNGIYIVPIDIECNEAFDIFLSRRENIVPSSSEWSTRLRANEKPLNIC